jgi:GNAT superfamily N-acetyltransferase
MGSNSIMTTADIRLLSEQDSLEDLTELLHRAYSELGAIGLRYKAVDQTVETTRSRIFNGECYLAIHDTVVIGTALLLPPTVRAAYCEWYDRPEVAVLGQFAVEPRFQRRGWGSRLIRHVEARALELGAEELSIDTSETATHLIELYQRRGYRHVGFAKWEHTNFRSVLLSKRLAPPE